MPGRRKLMSWGVPLAMLGVLRERKPLGGIIIRAKLHERVNNKLDAF